MSDMFDIQVGDEKIELSLSAFRKILFIMDTYKQKLDAEQQERNRIEKKYYHLVQWLQKFVEVKQKERIKPASENLVALEMKLQGLPDFEPNTLVKNKININHEFISNYFKLDASEQHTIKNIAAAIATYEK